jgi:AraC-like DNA-binding protein
MRRKAEQATFGLESRRVTAQVGATSHRHAEIELNFVERGALIYQFGAQQVALESGSVALFWAAIPHQIIECAEETILHWVTLPLATFLSWQSEREFVSAILGGNLITAAGVGDYLATFTRWGDDLRAKSDQRRRIVLLEIEAFTARMGLGYDHRAQESRPIHADKAQAMSRFIQAHYGELVSVEQIARHVDLHPNYAMTLFRQTFHMSILEYLTQFRIAHAQWMLLLTEESIETVAAESGFGSISQFYAIFKRAFGVSPRRYRVRGSQLYD